MTHCTLIHSLNGVYDKTVISALTEQGFHITEVPFEKAADSAVFSNTDAVIVCGGADWRNRAFGLCGRILKRRRKSDRIGRPAFPDGALLRGRGQNARRSGCNARLRRIR